MRKPHPNRLNLGRILPLFRRQRHTSRHKNHGQIAASRQRHHHRRQPLVARRHPHHPGSSRQRTNQPPQNNGRVIPIRQRIHHPLGPLRPPIARIGAKTGKRNGPPSLKFPRRRLHQQSHFPMSRVIPQRNRRPIIRPQPAGGRKNQKFFLPQRRR